MNNLPDFWHKFTLYTSPGFWLVFIVIAIAGACNGVYRFTKHLFRS